MESIKIALVHNGTEWVAENNKFTARGDSLDKLDEDIKNKLRPSFEAGHKVKVDMEFDYSTFPFWITQYHPYYFNRSVCFEF
jgi:hypothetical protein